MINVILPVSGWEVTLRQPAGAEDILLVEATVCDTNLALALISRIASLANQTAIPWDSLSLTDWDFLLLHIRKMVFGDLIRADAFCPAQGCNSRIEVAFQIQDYLSHHQPQNAEGVKPATQLGWFEFTDLSITFRLPSVADQIAVARHSQSELELIKRCIHPADIDSQLLQQVEQAMATIAPNLNDTLQGNCPECGATVDIYFDPQQFTLRELREQGKFIYEDVHLLASHYRWSEAEILALPRQRRHYYADKIRQDRRTM